MATSGALLLLSSLACVALGGFMALDNRTRERGFYFALWWTPAVAASIGILARDSVTFVVGALCFVVAGAVFFLESGSMKGGKPPARAKRTAAASASSEDSGTGEHPLFGGTKRRVPADGEKPLTGRVVEHAGPMLREAGRGLLGEARRLFKEARRWLDERTARSRK